MKKIVNYLSRFMVCLCVGFSCTGLLAQKTELIDQIVPVIGEDLEIKLEFDNHRTGEMVNLGYFTQSRESLVGAVSTVTGTELDRTPSSTLSQTMAGRLSGLTTFERNSNLNRANVLKWVRGVSSTNLANGNNHLVIIDGVLCPNMDIEYLSPKEIETVTILKDGSSTAIYGMQGSCGAIVINTKRGHVGKRRINVYIDRALQQMTRRPEFVSSYDYARLRNEAGVNDGLGAYSQFSQAQLNAFSQKTDPLYPNNNWYDMFVQKMTVMQRVGLNVSGGNEKMKYFSNVNYTYQTSPFIVTNDPRQKYDLTPNINMISFRSNLDLNFNKYLSAFMRFSGNVDYEQSAPHDNNTIYSLIFGLPPTMYGPLTPPDEENPELGGQVVAIDSEINPAYGLLNRQGYHHYLRTNAWVQSGVTLDMNFLIQGLSWSAMMAYQTYIMNLTVTTQDYARYVRSNDYHVLDFSRKGSQENTPLSYGKSMEFFYNLNLMSTMNYKRRFGDHNIDAMAYISYMKQERAGGALPYLSESMGVTALYGYKDKYFLKGDIAYSGSEQFHPDYRYTATPAVGAGWFISNEDFMADQQWVSLLKLRASYGITASDQFGGDRFLYLDFIDQWGSEGLRGNPKLSADKIKKQNYGIDLGLFNSLSLSFDYFMHHVDNQMVNSTGIIPAFQGIPLNDYPKLNNGKMENKGYEIEVMYNKQLTPDLLVFAGVSYSHSRNKIIHLNEMSLGDDYAYEYRNEGFSYGIPFGYLIDYSNGNGMFNSEDELSAKNLTYSFGTPRVGDFIYQDLNHDGIIDTKDQAPVGPSWIPENYYYFSVGLTFKRWELNFLFQGVGHNSDYINDVGAFENDRMGVFTDLHKNAWTRERYANNEKIDYPALSLSNSTNHQLNDFFTMDASFIRLRNMEIAYSLPVNIAKKMAAENIRLAFNAQNLFTIDRMKSKFIDPEIGYMATFQPYRVFNIGVSLNF